MSRIIRWISSSTGHRRPKEMRRHHAGGWGDGAIRLDPGPGKPEDAVGRAGWQRDPRFCQRVAAARRKRIGLGVHRDFQASASGKCDVLSGAHGRKGGRELPREAVTMRAAKGKGASRGRTLSCEGVTNRLGQTSTSAIANLLNAFEPGPSVAGSVHCIADCDHPIYSHRAATQASVHDQRVQGSAPGSARPVVSITNGGRSPVFSGAALFEQPSSAHQIACAHGAATCSREDEAGRYPRPSLTIRS